MFLQLPKLPLRRSMDPDVEDIMRGLVCQRSGDEAYLGSRLSGSSLQCTEYSRPKNSWKPDKGQLELRFPIQIHYSVKGLRLLGFQLFLASTVVLVSSRNAGDAEKSDGPKVPHG